MRELPRDAQADQLPRDKRRKPTMSHNLNLMIHAGGERVEAADLVKVVTPPGTSTWQPLPHHELLTGVRGSLEASGLHIAQEAHGLAHDGQRYFGMMQVTNGDEN